MDLLENTKKFVMPYYEDKDLMHDFSHIERFLKLANKFAVNYNVDTELLTLGAYLHGIIHINEKEIIDFFKSQKINDERIAKIVQVANDSLKKNTSGLIEGKILHDAHLLEGGKTFLIVKSLVTGTARGQSLTQTLDYIEKYVIGKFECILPEFQKEYLKKELYARDFLNNLKENL